MNSVCDWESDSATEASNPALAENTRRRDRESVPVEHANQRAAGKVPEPNHPELVAAGERAAIGAHGQRGHVSLVTVKRGDLTSRALPEHVPGKVRGSSSPGFLIWSCKISWPRSSWPFSIAALASRS